jgi:hypothetical protein
VDLHWRAWQGRIKHQYFRANGDIIRGVDFQRGTLAILTISTYMIRFRRPSEEEWVIVVPRRMVELVQEVLPQIVGSGLDSEEW